MRYEHESLALAAVVILLMILWRVTIAPALALIVWIAEALQEAAGSRARRSATRPI
jgi:hypothetical protein